MPFLYFKHIIYKIWGETGLKNVNSRDSNRYFWQLYSHNLILRTRTSVTGNLKNNYGKRKEQKREKRECKNCLEFRGSPICLRKLCFPTK